MKRLVMIVETEEYPQGILCESAAVVCGVLEEEAEYVEPEPPGAQMTVTVRLLWMDEAEIAALPDGP